MSPNRHSIEAVSTAKKFKTPLKASVVLLTSMILAACNTTDDPSYNLDDIFSPLPGATDKEVEKAKAEAEKAKVEAEAAKAEAAKKIAEAEKAAKAEAEAAKKAIAEAEKARVEAEKATADALKAKEEAEKALEDALANAGGGDKEALQKEADRKAKIASEAAVVAQTAADAQAAALAEAQAKIQAAQAAAANAEEVAANAAIKNAPETTKSGIQSLNVNVAPLSKVYNTTTRDFEATDNSIIARADIASESAPGKGDGLLGKLSITTSGDNDTKLQDGFMSHKDNAEVSAVGQKLPLAYTSTYKDFGDDMRIGHIDGKADFSGAELPVSGVAVVGNATKAANIPTEGKVGYTGDATYRKLGIGNNIEFGTSVFTADFVAKNIKGDLTFVNAGKIGLTAGINGNQFSGTAANNAGYSTEGGFFGGDAQYVGGVYEGNGAQGTYGAKSDKQTQADKAADKAAEQSTVAEKASAAAQAKAVQAQATAEKAKADAEKAKVAAEKAQAAADNAGSGDAGALQDALDRAEAAEQAAEKAKAEAAKAKAAAEAAAKKLVDAANAEAAAANKAAEQAKADAKKAKEDAEKAQSASKEEAAAAKKAAEAAEARAKAAEAKAQEAADKAKAAVEKAKADADARVAQAQKAAAEAAKKSEEKLVAAEKAKANAIKAKEAAQKALEDALAASGGDKEALQKEADRKALVAAAAQADAEAAATGATAAQAAAQAEVSAAAAAQQAAKDALAAAAIKNAPEAKKSGVQSINIDPSGAGIPIVFKTTTRDFGINDNGSVVDARADMASVTSPGQPGLLPAVPVTISGANDTDVKNGFKAHEDSTDITTNLGVLPLTYTSTYKDFGDDMRIGHIDGDAVLALDPSNPTRLPVNGAAVVGNATEAANVPTEGTVGYTGDATYRKLGIGNAIEFGTSVFTANFVAKNVKGDLSFDKAGKIGLTAGINGNQFSGSADANGGYLTEGGFFGGDAQYLGGVYEGKGAQGTYGAKSDNQTAAEQDAKDTKAQADAAKKALAAAQAEAAEAQAAAEQAQADAAKAKEAAIKAQEAADNAGSGGDDQALQDALDRAEAAEAAAKKAKEDADAAIQAAADKAQEEVKAAQDKVTAAQSEATAAKASAAAALAAADAAEKDAAAKIAAAKSAAAEDVTTAKAAADKAIADAAEAQADLEQAQANTQAAETKAAEAQADKLAAEQKAQELQAQLDALNPPTDIKKTGVQHISIDASGLGQGALTTTTREFSITDKTQVEARADEAAGELVSDPVALQVSGDNDAEVAGSNGFKSFENTTKVVTKPLGEVDLVYTSTYKDFGDDLRVAHIDGAAAGLLPVNGVAVVGNATEAANVPTEGKVGYTGDATYRELGEGKTIQFGTSVFTADFVAKNLKGDLTFTDKKIGLEAKIAGNQFSGSKDGYNADGGFYGGDAQFIGGIYEGNGAQGTYGAGKDSTPVEPTEPTLPENITYAPDENVTGLQSFTLSNGTAIGFREFWNDTDSRDADDNNDDFTNTDNGNNFADGYKSIVARADLTKPDTVLEPVAAVVATDNDVDYAGGNGFQNYKGDASVQTSIVPAPLQLAYDSVYKNFNSQMQIGHIYGDAKLNGVFRAARVSSTYVEGNLTAADDMKYMEDLAAYDIANGGDGKVGYEGVATYMENLHFNDTTGRNGPTVDGSAKFNVDFVNKQLEGTLTFKDGDYKYMPEGNKISISAGIDGSNFASPADRDPAVDNVQTAGGFYGEDANYLGGIYQNALQPGGSGGGKGTGTTFQGTFGAEKAAKQY